MFSGFDGNFFKNSTFLPYYNIRKNIIKFNGGITGQNRAIPLPA